MPSIDKNTLAKLVDKYGPNIDLRANPQLLNDILNDVLTETRAGGRVAFLREEQGYHKSYLRDEHDDNCYDRRYSQYDRTDDDFSFNRFSKLRPEQVQKFDIDLVAKYAELLKRLREIDI
jgi:hypothetical protein